MVRNLGNVNMVAIFRKNNEKNEVKMRLQRNARLMETLKKSNGLFSWVVLDPRLLKPDAYQHFFGCPFIFWRKQIFFTTRKTRIKRLEICPILKDALSPVSPIQTSTVISRVKSCCLVNACK